ncbi:MAG: AbrB/MazE/SpoVT family DNA-binding domain-containing protein [Armatimonadota bacterium]
MSVVRVSARFQVLIPKRIRARLGIKPGQRFLVTDKDGTIVLTPAPSDPVAYLCGALKEETPLSEELLADRKRGGCRR